MTDLAVSRGILAQPGTVAFLVIFGMGVILFFVFRSMAKHLRKINMAARAEAEASAKAEAAAKAQGTEGAASDGGHAGGRGAPGDRAAASDAAGAQNTSHS